MSQVGGDLSKIQSGPCKVTVGGQTVGHTMEGVKFNDQPDLRKRMVDEYGTHNADMVYQGETLTVAMTLAQKTMAVLQLVYQWGYGIDTVTQGWGLLPQGQTGQDLAQALVLHPLGITGTQQDVTIYKAVVSASSEVNFGVATADRVFGVTFTALVDESKGNGILGKIGGPTPA